MGGLGFGSNLYPGVRSNVVTVVDRCVERYGRNTENARSLKLKSLKKKEFDD